MSMSHVKERACGQVGSKRSEPDLQAAGEPLGDFNPRGAQTQIRSLTSSLSPSGSLSTLQ